MALVLLLLLYYRWMWTPSRLLLYEFVWLQCQLLSLVLLLCEIEVPFPDLLLLCIWVTCFCHLFVNPVTVSKSHRQLLFSFLWMQFMALCCISWNMETQARPHISALISALPSLTVGHSSLSVHLGLAVILMGSFCGAVHVELLCCCCPPEAFFQHCLVCQTLIQHSWMY